MKLVVLILTLVFSAMTYAETLTACFELSDLGQSKVSITGYTCSETEVVIPQVISGKSVIEIGDYAFNERSLRSVVIPEGVTRIGRFTFFDTGLKSVSLPKTLVIIDELAFWNNRIEVVDLPDGLTTIGYGAFQINGLRELIIPDSVTEMGYYAFERNLLGRVVLSKNLTSIPEGAFNENSLFSVSIPEGVRTIGRHAFDNNRIGRLNLPQSLEEIGQFAFRFNYLTSLLIPHNVKKIGAGAFFKNQLQFVEVPGATFLDDVFDAPVLVERSGLTFDGYWAKYDEKSEFKGVVTSQKQHKQELLLSEDNKDYYLKTTHFKSNGTTEVNISERVTDFVSPQLGQERVDQCIENGGLSEDKLIDHTVLETCDSGGFIYASVPFGLFGLIIEAEGFKTTSVLIDFGKD